MDLCVLLFLVFSLTLGGNGVEGTRKNRKRLSSRPNIIFILLDDLDIQLGSMQVMTKTRALFEKYGVEFVNAFVTSPICCPSRSSILTGMYAHNHGCLTNTVNCASMTWRRGPERKNFGHYLQQNGYRTGYFGKYLNNYDGSWIPRGWDNWSALLKNSKFYNYTLNRNKVFQRHGHKYEKDYSTDVITNYSIEFFRESRFNDPQKPVMMVVSLAAPHGPEDPAPQHKDLFPNVTAPRHPNYNVHSADKHWILQYTKPMDEKKIAFTDHLHRRRLLTLLSVDDAIHRLYSNLKQRGMLDNTYIFLSSDHGYHLGQFGLAKGKSMPYETDIRVPFYALGPNVPRGKRIKDIVLNIDLAPTFLNIARAKIPGSMDGRSVLKLFDQYRRKNVPLKWRETFLIEKSKSLYGSNDRKASKTKANMIREKCRLLSYPLPCKEGQQWTCAMYKGQLRLRKCRRVTNNNSGTRKRLSRSLSARYSLGPRRCRCSRKGRGRYSYRRHGKRDVMPKRRDFYRWEFKSARARKEAKKLRSYERHLSKESSASYVKKAMRKSIQARLKKLNLRIKASRARLAELRMIKKSLSRLMYRKESQPRIWCRCFRGRAHLFERVTPANIRRSPKKRLATMKRKSSTAAKNRLTKQQRRKIKKSKKKRKHNCGARGLNCFQHTNRHWKTEPLWKNGNFCFCPTSSNNSYWCLRSINAKENYLYCEFVTSFCEFFDLNSDPYQLKNKISTISRDFHERLHKNLAYLASCRHSNGCEMYPGRKVPNFVLTPLEKACTNRRYLS